MSKLLTALAAGAGVAHFESGGGGMPDTGMPVAQIRKSM
jgi:hypothetical protein